MNRVYPPAGGATGQLLAELAPALVDAGWKVTVVTGSGAGRDGHDSETIKGVQVERVGGLAFSRASHWRRALAYASLYPILLWRALRLPRHDVVVTLTDPPLLALLGPIVRRLKRCALVHWAQDLYPELAEELGVIRKGGMLAGVLRRLSTLALKSCDAVIPVGRCMRDRLESRGLDPARLQVIPNWSHVGKFSPGAEREANPFRLAHQWTGRFVVMYSGNLGLAHPFEAILDAAERLASAAPAVLFAFVGDGPRLPWVREQVRTRSIGNVVFLPFQPKEMLSESLAAADVHLASMLENLVGLVVPSKVYGILGAGRPCLFLGPEGSEAARLIFEHGCGSVLTEPTGHRLAACIEAWRSGQPPVARDVKGNEPVWPEVGLDLVALRFAQTLERVCRGGAKRGDEPGIEVADDLWPCPECGRHLNTTSPKKELRSF